MQEERFPAPGDECSYRSLIGKRQDKVGPGSLLVDPVVIPVRERFGINEAGVEHLGLFMTWLRHAGPPGQR